MKKNYILLSLFLAVMITITAIYGIFIPGTYSAETANWATQSMAQDWANLVIAVPLLMVSSYFVNKKFILGLIVWTGNMLFIIYSFLIYAFMVHFNQMFFFYVAILGISTYLLIFMLLEVDYSKIKSAFSDNWSRKTVARTLMGLGSVFYLVWLKDALPGVLNGTVPKSIVEAGLFTNGVYVIDMALCLPLLIISGLYLLRGKAAGYFLAGASMVFSAVMMINIAFIIYFVGYKGLPTDYSIAYVFGLLGLIVTGLSIKYISSFQQ